MAASNALAPYSPTTPTRLATDSKASSSRRVRTHTGLLPLKAQQLPAAQLTERPSSATKHVAAGAINAGPQRQEAVRGARSQRHKCKSMVGSARTPCALRVPVYSIDPSSCLSTASTRRIVIKVRGGTWCGVRGAGVQQGEGVVPSICCQYCGRRLSTAVSGAACAPPVRACTHGRTPQSELTARYRPQDVEDGRGDGSSFGTLQRGFSLDDVSRNEFRRTRRADSAPI